MIDPDRAVGCVVGSAVGDALGAPFEFGPEGAFSARFPRPGQGGEMCGGGGWEPGEATDDTQMAVLVGESLLEHGGLEPATRRRGRARPSPRAGADRPDRRRPAGSAPGRPRRGTSGPPRALRDRPRPRLDPDLATEFNGAVWPCLGSAVWALRTTSSYEEVVRAAVDLGGNTPGALDERRARTAAGLGRPCPAPARPHGPGASARLRRVDPAPGSAHGVTVP